MKFTVSNVDTFTADTVRVTIEVDLANAEEAVEFIHRICDDVLPPMNLS